MININDSASKSSSIFDMVKSEALKKRKDMDDHGGVPPLLKRDPELAQLAELAKKDTLRERRDQIGRKTNKR